MTFTDETIVDIKARITALTAERDNFVAEANRTIANLNGRIAELQYLLDVAADKREAANEL